MYNVISNDLDGNIYTYPSELTVDLSFNDYKVKSSEIKLRVNRGINNLNLLDNILCHITNLSKAIRPILYADGKTILAVSVVFKPIDDYDRVKDIISKICEMLNITSITIRLSENGKEIVSASDLSLGVYRATENRFYTSLDTIYKNEIELIHDLFLSNKKSKY